MPDPDLESIRRRLSHIQDELSLMRLRDEQREASHQALTATLSRQMVEVSTGVDQRLAAIDDRLTAIEETLREIPAIKETLQQILARVP
jgi:DNA repair exonuclease SbcCD ATPase subunit